jgi:benzoyl-CoA reductase/2-hydroxyglutaryl-CoA dehydratase subunit BcrC/BadD/HgdB
MRLPTLNPGNRPPIGFVTAYVPEEILHAAGFTPVFIFHTPEDRGYARAHLPGFTCWVAASALDQALAGTLDGMAGMVLAHTCDTMQGLTDIWRRNVPGIPLLHFGMPLQLERPSARVYLLAELRSLCERVQALTGHPISADALRESIALYNRARASVRRLYARAADLAPTDLYRHVRAALQTPEGETGGRKQETGDKTQEAEGPRVILVGPELGDPALFEVLEQAGARVVGDLFDVGERYFALDAAEGGDPLEALAGRLLALVPTPTKHHGQRTRTAHLLALVRERNAHGVIFARQKFCDPHGFDTVQQAHVLRQAGVPYLVVELEQASQAGQLRTRVEAFTEMLAHG